MQPFLVIRQIVMKVGIRLFERRALEGVSTEDRDLHAMRLSKRSSSQLAIECS
jgi:hypothetical protein